MDVEATDPSPYPWGEAISHQEFSEAGLDDLTADNSAIDARHLARALDAKVIETTDARLKRPLEIISSLLSMMPRLYKPAEPYGAMWEMEGRRSFIPTDFHGAQRDELQKLLADVKQPALRARIADVCWLLKKRESSAGAIAVEAYGALLDRIGTGRNESHLASYFIDRGLLISRALGAESTAAEIFNGSLSRLLARIEDPKLYRRVAAAALHHRHDLAARIADELSNLLASTEPNELDKQDCLDLLAQAHRRNGDMTACQEAMRQAAECSMVVAAQSGSGMVSAHWYRDAMVRFRRVPGQGKRAREAEEFYRDKNSEALGELSSFSHEVDVTDEVERINKFVSAPTWAAAARAFALIGRSPEPEEVRDQALALARENPLSAIVGAEIYDQDGLVVARSPGLNLNGLAEDAEALKFYIARQESVRRTMSAQMFNRARLHIAAQHSAEYEFVRWVVQSSPFVPDDKHRTFAYGFIRYFEGDLTGAAYVLVPQIEASLRYLIKAAGGDVVTTKADGTQTPAALGRLLTMLRTMEPRVLPDSYIDDIDHIFDYAAGPRLRHSIAHGQESDDGIFSLEVEYALWFIWHLTVIPLLRDWPAESQIA